MIDSSHSTSFVLRRGRAARIIARACAFLVIAAAGVGSAGAQTPAPMTAPGGLVISPKNGQGAEQQSADRYECHTWAMGQTGYDPTSSTAGSPAQSPKLAPYRRAMGACLEAKGYGVAVNSPASGVPAAPVAPPPPPAAPTRPYVAPAFVGAPAVVRQPDLTPTLDYHPFRMQIAGGYSIPTGPTNGELDGGAAAGLGFAWFPAPSLPIGVRVDGSYNWFRARNALLEANGADRGEEHLYGGDADLQLDLAHRSSQSKLYLLGGVGWYRENTELKTYDFVNGFGCGFSYCGSGRFPVSYTVQNSTSPWHQSWNAGFGWEIALAQRSSFFIEARYEHIRPNSGAFTFVPVTVGFRF